MNELLTGKFRPNFTFMKWFKKFFYANERQGREYNPVEARNGQDIVHVDEAVKSPKSWKSPHESGKPPLFLYLYFSFVFKFFFFFLLFFYKYDDFKLFYSIIFPSVMNRKFASVSTIHQ